MSESKGVFQQGQAKRPVLDGYSIQRQVHQDESTVADPVGHPVVDGSQDAEGKWGDRHLSIFSLL